MTFFPVLVFKWIGVNGREGFQSVSGGVRFLVRSQSFCVRTDRDRLIYLEENRNNRRFNKI